MSPGNKCTDDVSKLALSPPRHRMTLYELKMGILLIRKPLCLPAFQDGEALSEICEEESNRSP